MLRNTYGTNQEHLEPEHVQNIMISVPRDSKLLEEIDSPAVESILCIQKGAEDNDRASCVLDRLLHVAEPIDPYC